MLMMRLPRLLCQWRKNTGIRESAQNFCGNFWIFSGSQDISGYHSQCRKKITPRKCISIWASKFFLRMTANILCWGNFEALSFCGSDFRGTSLFWLSLSALWVHVCTTTAQSSIFRISRRLFHSQPSMKSPRWWFPLRGTTAKSFPKNNTRT